MLYLLLLLFLLLYLFIYRSVVESSSTSFLDERLIKAGQTSSITSEIIFYSTMYPWCRYFFNNIF
jgi:hypothetical protein